MTIKIRTNLTPEELEEVAKGIKVAADKQRRRPYKPENNAESELIRKADSMFQLMLDSLQDDVAEVLLGKRNEHE